MIRAARHSVRLIRVAFTLARHDALFPLELLGDLPWPVRILKAVAKLRPATTAEQIERPGARLARALQDLGPTFIKLGQGMATRPDFVGIEVAQDLANLQDKLPPFPGTEARAIIATEFGKPVEDLFVAFDDHAIAAASIAQVHFAVLKNGTKVAVKVLRPGVEQAFARDLESFRWAAGLLERARPDMKRLRPTDVIDTFAQSVALEMDLRYEAAAASELKENLADDPQFSVPAVIWPVTARRILTLERVEGIALNDHAALVAANLDLPATAQVIVQSFLKQALFDGFFHADLHQGNLFAAPDGRIIAVDFGIMGRLDPETRRVFAEILYGFLRRDYNAVAAAHFRAGYVPPGQSQALFAQALRAIGEPITDSPVKEISLGGLLAQLLKTTETFAMQTQPQLLLLQKTMVMVEGVASKLDPDVNMWELSRPVIERWMRENLGPQARIKDGVTRIASLIERAPAFIDDLEHIVADARRSGLRLRLDSDGAPRGYGQLIWPLLAGLVGGGVALAIYALVS